MMNIYSVLLQLRTYATAGSPKALSYTFFGLDVVVVVALAGLAAYDGKIGRAMYNSDPGVPYEINFHGTAYDPYLWAPLAPLELFTLSVNVYLAWKAYRTSKQDGIRMPKLMMVILRDNICYLTV